jgi:hypothetical protein
MVVSLKMDENFLSEVTIDQGIQCHIPKYHEIWITVFWNLNNTINVTILYNMTNLYHNLCLQIDIT